MSLPTLTASHVFGLNQDVRNNVCYLDETSVIYPAGLQIVQYNIEQRTQKIIPVHVDGEAMSTMAVSATGSCVAIGIRILSSNKSTPEMEKNATVMLYDLQTGRRRKVFSTGEASSTKEFISIALPTTTSTLGLYMWSLDKGKMVTWTKTTTNATTDVSLMTCNHHDPINTQICATGNNLFRIFRFVEGVFKMAHQNKMDKNILCHSWVNESRIVAGTQDSKILIFDAGELVLEISYVIPHSGNSIIPAVNTIMSFSSGLIAGLSTGVGVLFDKTEDTFFYKKSKEFLLEEAEISCIALGPHEDTAVVTMKNSQIYNVSFDADTKGDEVKCDRLAQSFHTGNIVGMDVSVSKPLLVTSGIDKSIRVWNYMDSTVEVVKYFEDAAQCVAIHPNGLYLLAGFPTTLKLMAILIDDIRPFWDTNIRGCKECHFSNGGQYFAAVWGASVVIYNTWSFDVIGHLKSQTGKIKSIAWSNDDNKMITFTADGVVSQWNLATLKKEVDIPGNSTLEMTAAMNHTAKLIYTVSAEGNIREIVNGMVAREIPAKTSVMHVIMSKSGQMLFSTTTKGGVRSLRYPFSQDFAMVTSDYQEHAFHSAPITQIRTSFDDQYLFTCSEDGCVWIFRIQDRDGRSIRREKDWTYSDEILVTKSDLRENYRTMSELKQRVDELKAESDAQLKIKDNAYNLKIKEVTDKYTAEVEALKMTAATLKQDAEDSEVDRKRSMVETKKMHKEELWMHETNMFYKKKLQEKQDVIQKSKGRFQHQKQEFEGLMTDIDSDVEKESLEIVYNFEIKLKEERESLLTIREENLNMKSKFDGLTRQIEEHKRELAKSITEEKKLHAIIRSFENDIKKNQELEKFKFVLDYKIVELHKQVEPREKDIVKLTDQIKVCTKVPGHAHAHHATHRDHFSEEWRHKQVMAIIRRFQRDLRSVYKHRANMGELKRHLIALYHKYRDISTDPPENPLPHEIPNCTNTELFLVLDRLGEKIGAKRGSTADSGSGNVDELPLPNEEEMESARTREHLEKTVGMLKEQLTKDDGKRVENSQKMVLENITLTSEVNSLRMDLQAHRERLYKLHDAKKNRIPLRDFIAAELKTKTVKQLVDPPVTGDLLHKTTMPLPPVLPPIPARPN
ncbi:WD40-repeat-containing domain protein [Entophlyctis helioformis]|nr:WD40-repeat-containing domain protein [Entophlyctis helioformis]